MAIETEKVLEAIGFKLQGSSWSYSLATDNLELELKASRGFNRLFADVFGIDGNFKSNRTIGSVHIDMPLTCESLEQGMAFLAYGLRSYRLALFQEDIGWFKQGHACHDLLPFIREAKAREERYQNRPHCLVDRDWLRTVRKKFLQLTEDVSSLSVSIKLNFDGRLLSFSGDCLDIAVQATGKPWEMDAVVSGSLLLNFPKRFQRDPVVVEILDDYLGIDRVRYPLLNKSGGVDGG